MGLNVADLFSMTYRSLRGNALRSGLTTLGMFMGVVAVGATLQVRHISEAVIAQQLAERNAPRVTVGLERRRRRDRTEMRLQDITVLRQKLPAAMGVTGISWLGPTVTIFQNREANPGAMAVTQDYLLTEGLPLVAGRFFTQTDFERYRSVAVIDQFLSERLFRGQNPVGQTIYARQRPFIIVGVLPTRVTADAQPGGQLLIPMATYHALTGRQAVMAMQLRPRSLEQLDSLTEATTGLMKQRFPGSTPWAWNNVDDILQQKKTLELASQALTVVALISLLVGGVGIANVMIASVAERTPEIGLRRAIGATRQEIWLQFILEAVILSLLGGTAAVLTVHGLTLAVTERFKLPYQFDPNSSLVAIGAALLVGVGAGFPPALRASQIDPVRALRSE